MPLNRFLGPVDDYVTTNSTLTKSQSVGGARWSLSLRVQVGVLPRGQCKGLGPVALKINTQHTRAVPGTLNFEFPHYLATCMRERLLYKELRSEEEEEEETQGTLLTH